MYSGGKTFNNNVLLFIAKEEESTLTYFVYTFRKILTQAEIIE